MPATPPNTAASSTIDFVEDDNATCAEALWQAFFVLNKITDGKTDGEGACALRLNGLRTLASYQCDDELLVVKIQLGVLPKVANLRSAFCEALLVQATDLIEGDVVGIDPVEDAAVYQRTLSLSDLSAQDLTNELWDMVDAVSDLQLQLPPLA